MIPSVLRISSLALSLLLVSAGTASAAGKTVEQATAAEKKEAGDLYTAAMTEFEADRYEPALKGFRESYGIVRSPNSHFMIARSLARLGRNTEAYQELQAVIDEARAMGPSYEDTVTAAYAKQEEIRPRLGLVTITLKGLPKGTIVTVSGEALTPEQLGHAVPVLPGDTKISFRTPQGKTGSRTVHLEPGGAADAELVPEADVSQEERDLPFPERDEHQPHQIEVEAHFPMEVLEPPGNATRGVGVGGRVGVQLLPRGLVKGLNDGVSVTAGGDYIATSNDDHVLVPVAAQYNLWLTPAVSLLIEPGVALLVGAGTHVSPVLAIGGRCRLWKNLHVTGKLGVPATTIGLAWLQ